MVMVTRSMYRKASESSNSDVSLSFNNVNPPWCSGRVHERRKTRKIISPAWEIRSSYPLRENIWEYLNNDSKRQNFGPNKRKKCKHSVAKQNGNGRCFVSFILLAVLLGLVLYFWIPHNISNDMMAIVLPKEKLFSLLRLDDSTSVGEECCHRMRHLALTLSRTEQALRNTLRLRRTMMLTLEHSKAETETPTTIGGRYIQGASVVKGRGTKEWGGRVALWGVVPLWRASPPPETVLALRKPTPSDCWPFSGSYGEIIIELAETTRVSCISLEHVRPDTAQSAPKSFIVYGILENGTWIKAGDGVYRHNKPAKQYYSLDNRNAPLKHIVFRVLSNQGNPKYTCIYRIHMYGSDDKNLGFNVQ